MLPVGFQSAYARLIRVLPPIPSRALAERTDALVDAVWSIDFLPGGTGLVAACIQGLQCWDFEAEAPRWTLPHSSRGEQRVAVSPDGQLFVSAGGEEGVVLRALATGQPLRELLSPAFGAAVLTYSPDGKTLLWAGSEVPPNPSGLNVPKVVVWSAADHALLWSAVGEDWQPTRAGHASSDVVYLDGSRSRRRFEARSGTELEPEKRAFDPFPIRSTPLFIEYVFAAGLKVVAAEGEPRLQLQNLDLPDEPPDVIELPDPDLDRVTTLAVAPDGHSLAVGTWGGAVLLFALEEP